MLRFAMVATLATGCMNLTLNSMIEKPGQHDSPMTVVFVGGMGDLVLASGAAGAHAITRDASTFSAWQEEFKDVAPYWILPVIAVDLVVALIRINHLKH